jgi:hypothetical protein
MKDPSKMAYINEAFLSISKGKKYISIFEFIFAVTDKSKGQEAKFVQTKIEEIRC